jgi:heme/copper-type cytochrome/quinol oxidase subunit 2
MESSVQVGNGRLGGTAATNAAEHLRTHLFILVVVLVVVVLVVVVAVEIVVVGTPRTEGAEGGCGGAP